MQVEDSFKVRKWGEDYRQHVREVLAINFVKGWEGRRQWD